MTERLPHTLTASVRYGEPALVSVGGKIMTEQIMPGCFRQALKKGTDILALLEHDPAKPLARTGDGSLRLTDTDNGLVATIERPDTEVSYISDLCRNHEAGRVRGLSPRLVPRPGGLTVKDGIRTITDAHLLEVSWCTVPTWQGLTNSAAMRSAAEVTATWLTDLPWDDECEPEPLDYRTRIKRVMEAFR